MSCGGLKARARYSLLFFFLFFHFLAYQRYVAGFGIDTGGCGIAGAGHGVGVFFLGDDTVLDGLGRGGRQLTPNGGRSWRGRWGRRFFGGAGAQQQA